MLPCGKDIVLICTALLQWNTRGTSLQGEGIHLAPRSGSFIYLEFGARGGRQWLSNQNREISVSWLWRALHEMTWRPPVMPHLLLAPAPGNWVSNEWILEGQTLSTPQQVPSFSTQPAYAVRCADPFPDEAWNPGPARPSQTESRRVIIYSKTQYDAVTKPGHSLLEPALANGKRAERMLL